MKDIKDLDKSEYLEYTAASHNIMSDYNGAFWVFSLLTIIGAVSINIEGLTFYNIFILSLSLSGLIFNYVQVMFKLNHIKKLLNINNRLSFLK